MTPPSLSELREYVAFSPADSEALKRLLPALPRVLDAIVEDFYAEIQRHDESRAAIADAAQLERLKASLHDWVRSVLSGPRDSRWLEAREQIGRRHVEVGLPQRFMPLAMGRLRVALTRLALEESGDDPRAQAEAVVAVQRALDLELTIMLESYGELHQERVRQAERLGTIGRLAASVSHELKNPLAVINTSLLLLEKLLAAPQRDAAAIAAHVDRIRRSSRQAGSMAAQLLDYARVKRPEERTVGLAALLDDALAMVEERQEVAVEVRCEPADATVRLDPGEIAGVIANLVRNAAQSIRESGQGGRVTVRARRDPVGVTVVVSDDGPGISVQPIERVFEPLVTTRPNGTGLGLAIARERVAAHGGRLTAASTPGRGAVFTVMLPQGSGEEPYVSRGGR